ncbi:MAG: tRNA pseudouridine(55) synthase TruB [Alphaproteobacteria bacterium]|nr:tRNA pseudouridine(55) synthase TruB [Alphaproteobacteria bacterium]
MTSRQAGWRIAKMFGQRKFGHIGTLDPMASGVLPIALGEATKMIPYLDGTAVQKGTRHEALGNSRDKEYEFSIKWGIETDTGDMDGNIIKENTRCPVPSAQCLFRACAELIGEIEQTPPVYSAIKINGKKAYELARKGIDIEMPVRRVEVRELRVELDKFTVKCSAGTYVRTLVQQIIEKINQKSRTTNTNHEHDFIGTTNMIRRTGSNGFLIKDAVSLDFLENLYNNSPADIIAYLQPIDFGLEDILVLELNETDAMRFDQGQVISNQEPVISGLRRVYHSGKFLGIAELVGGQLKPRRVMNN